MVARSLVKPMGRSVVPMPIGKPMAKKTKPATDKPAVAKKAKKAEPALAKMKANKAEPAVAAKPPAAVAPKAKPAGKPAAAKHKPTMSDYLYHRFMNLRLAEGQFVNMPTLGSIRTVKFQGFKKPDETWEMIRCKQAQLTPKLQVKTECNSPQGGEFTVDNPRRYKVFVRWSPAEKQPPLRSLRDYIKALQSGALMKEDHDALLAFIDHQRMELKKALTEEYNLVWSNDNLDVGILHFKIAFAGDDF